MSYNRMFGGWRSRLDEVLCSWRGTPWVAGQCLRGPKGGVDCVHFVVAVLDELHEVTLPPIARLPQDMSLHDRSGAMRVARAIEERYVHVVLDPTLPQRMDTGDVILFRAGKEGGPGHVAIAGLDPRMLWHASPGVGVCTTSRAASNEVLRIWRPAKREEW